MAVRNESVRLSLQDDFTSGMARATAAAAMFKRELDDLDGSNVSRGLGDAAQGIDRVGNSARRNGADIDAFSGRLRLMAEAATILGPAVIPLGAAAIPALTGALAGLGAAAGGIGATVLAFQGMGDALDALDKARLEPTTENLNAMRDALTELGPAGAEFAQYLDSLRPLIDELQNTAREGLFPGLQEGIDSLIQRAPQVQTIIENLATGMGNLASDAGESLSSDAWSPFFDYVERTAQPTLEAFGQATGNVALGLANMLVALEPVTADFAQGLVKATQSFADWSAGLEDNAGFQEFVAYIRESGPQAIEFLGAIGRAFAGLIEAAAPFGAAVLPALTALANAFAAIASSDIGPVLYTAIAGLLAFNRAAALTARASTLLASSFGPWGLAVGAATGLVLEFKTSYDDLRGSIEGLDSAIASGSIPELTAQLTAARAELDGMRSDEENISVGESLLGGFRGLTDIKQGVGFLTGATGDLGDSVAEAEEKLASLRANGGYAIGTMGHFAFVMRDSADAAREEADALYESISAMQAKRAEALRALNAELNYQAAIDDANRALKENGKNFDVTTEKGRANRQVLYALADGWNQQSDAAKNAKGSLQSARQNFIETARQMGATADQAKNLADRLFEIPPKRHTEITADVAQANAAIDAVKARMNSLQSKTIAVTVVQRTVRPQGGQAPGSALADGGTVPGPRYPYADRTLILAAPGEEVITNRNGEADRFRADRAAGRIPAYADGGSILPTYTSRRDSGDTAATRSVWLLADAADSAGRGLKGLQSQLDKSEKALEKQKSALDATNSAMASLSSSVSGKFDVDLGAKPSNVWAAGSGGALSSIATMTAQAGALPSIIAALKAAGLTGPALAEVLQEMDFSQLAALSANPSQASQLNVALSGLYSAQAVAGGASANAVYGEQRARELKHLEGIEREVRELRRDVRAADKNNQKTGKDNAKDVSDFINGAASNGQRRRKGGGRR